MVASMRPQAIKKVTISALVISLPIIYVALLHMPPSTLARDSTFWFLMSNSIIVIIAADSGMLFFSSADHDDNLSNALGDQTVQEDYHNMMSVPSHEPTVPSGIDVIVGGGEQLPTGGTVSCKAANTDMNLEEDHALALLKGEGDTGHASVLRKQQRQQQRQEEEEEEEEEAAAAASVVLEPITANNKDAMMVKGDQWTIPQARITVTPDDHVPQDQDEGSVEVAMEPRYLVTEEERKYWQLSDEELNRKIEEFITRFNRDMIQQETAISSTYYKD